MIKSNMKSLTDVTLIFWNIVLIYFATFKDVIEITLLIITLIFTVLRLADFIYNKYKELKNALQNRKRQKDLQSKIENKIEKQTENI